MSALLPDLLKAVLSPIAAAIGFWILSKIPAVRIWFVGDPVEGGVNRAPFLRLSAAIGAVAGACVAVAFWIFLPTKSGFPSGLVVASLESCDRLGADWSPFVQARGRFIVGADDHSTEGVSVYTVFGAAAVNGKNALNRGARGTWSRGLV